MTSDHYAAARELEPELVSFMQDIIRIPSLSSEEGAVIDRIREEMLAIGYQSERGCRATHTNGDL